MSARKQKAESSTVRYLELAIIAYRKCPNRRNERRLQRARVMFTNQGRI